MHEVLVNLLGGLSLPRKSVVRLTDRPNMTLDVYRGRKTTKQHWLQITQNIGAEVPKHLGPSFSEVAALCVIEALHFLLACTKKYKEHLLSP